MKRSPWLATLALLASSAASAAVLQAGLPVTGTLDGAAAGLLGHDHGYAAVAGLVRRADVFHRSTIATGAPGGWVPAP